MSLDVHDISFSYHDSPPIIENFRLTLDSGQILILTGPNGSGKTTALKLLSGLLKPTCGKILWNQNPVHEAMSTFAWHDTYPGTHKYLSIKKIEFFEKKIYNINNIKYYFEQEYKESAPFFRLSSGEKKKLMLNLTLNKNAKVFFFDEPETSLDKKSVEIFYETIRQKTKKGAIAILATHYDMRDLVPENTLFFSMKKDEDE